MDELNKESEVESNLLAELERSTKVIALSVLKSEISMTDFVYQYKNERAVYWLNFFGYIEKKENDELLLVVKDVFRSVCSKFGVVFIDLSFAS
jgi:hypothetical protein